MKRVQRIARGYRIYRAGGHGRTDLPQPGLRQRATLAIARRSGVDGRVLFDTLAMGSADSFALRNHGMKAMLPGEFPERAFSTAYARKDIEYALQLAQSVGIDADAARHAHGLLTASIERGDGDLYWPVIARVVDGGR